eukprot:TRINITY_DN73795_c0_g1_i1.p1 TRINITY_DN73795_c0_g1~~TRINITY_DN73795_c0_g1_i1.p1  ORF type:complete len:300 (+),score=60.14 TRINITY_DN73795_c0_g1_i1:61-960(+)
MSEKKGVVELSHQPALSGDWSFEAQIKALESCSQERDDTFKERSVRDVTDKGRMQGAAQLLKVLEDVLSKAPKALTNGTAQGTSSSSSKNGRLLPLQEVSEVATRKEVKSLLKRLQELREEGRCGASLDNEAMDVLAALDSLPVSVTCLKATKVAVELTQTFWRSNCVGAEVQRDAAALVKRWRVMYKASEGHASTVSPAVQARHCKNVSMDLEECVHSSKQRVQNYQELIRGSCALLLYDKAAAGCLVSGTLGAKDFVKKVERELLLIAKSRRASSEQAHVDAFGRRFVSPPRRKSFK